MFDVSPRKRSGSWTSLDTQLFSLVIYSSLYIIISRTSTRIYSELKREPWGQAVGVCLVGVGAAFELLEIAEVVHVWVVVQIIDAVQFLPEVRDAVVVEVFAKLHVDDDVVDLRLHERATGAAARDQVGADRGEVEAGHGA